MTNGIDEMRVLKRGSLLESRLVFVIGCYDYVI